jgi:hypothetical protein
MVGSFLGCCARAASGHAAAQRDEVAAVQLIEVHSVPCQQARAGFAGYRIGAD